MSSSSLRPLFPVFFTVLIDLLGFGLVIPLMAYYAGDFDATPVQITMLMAVYSFAQFLFAPVWGAISDNIGRRPVMLFSIAGATVCLAGFASSTELWQLFLFRALHGAFAANISTAQAYVADLTTPENRSKGMGLIGASFGVGFTLGPWMGGELGKFGHSWPIWAAAILSAANFVWALVGLPESRPKPGTHTGRTIDPRAMWQAIRHPNVGFAILLTFVSIFSFALMESTFSLVAERNWSMNIADVGRTFGAIGVIGIVIQGGMIHRLTRMFGERSLIRAGLVANALGLLGLVSAVLGADAPWVAILRWSGCALLAVGSSLLNPSLNSLISRGVSADEQGSVLGANQSLSALARAGSTCSGGPIYQHLGASSPFQIGAVLLFLALPLAIFGINSPRPRGGQV